MIVLEYLCIYIYIYIYIKPHNQRTDIRIDEIATPAWGWLNENVSVINFTAVSVKVNQSN
jgi:hypothetical protein